MAQQCVHKGCEKSFVDSNEHCVYHPGPPEFHEGQKGWKCCKPRVLTFDEFLEIPPCTTGKHSTVDDTPNPEPPAAIENELPPPKPVVTKNGASRSPPISRVPLTPQSAAPATPPPQPESESDDASLPVPRNATCKRRGCNVTSPADFKHAERGDEECIHHPGQPLFHEGSKGWTCCRRKVLEFDEFMKIEGCMRKKKHLFVGNRKKDGIEESLSDVRHDFYQTPTTVIASYYLKKIDKARAEIQFTSSTTVILDLPTVDNKRYNTELLLFGSIDASKSTYRIMGTKLELTLAKVDGLGWPVLRSDEEKGTDIIQVGRAGRA